MLCQPENQHQEELRQVACVKMSQGTELKDRCDTETSPSTQGGPALDKVAEVLLTI